MLNRADQDGRFADETTSPGCGCAVGVAPLHEINIREAQRILIKIMINFDMARNLTERRMIGNRIFLVFLYGLTNG